VRLLLILAWRNIWRNRRRSVLTILAVVFATFLTLIQRGVATGTWEFNIQNSVEMFSGYLQVQKSGYRESPSLAKSVPYPSTLRSILMQTEGIKGFVGDVVRELCNDIVEYDDNPTGATASDEGNAGTTNGATGPVIAGDGF